ncbi:C6 zinc finger domain-containing protein [Colletotrichum truncatum]|uniref:C6 zinc finger domain-containing protein n=1 Tax=Colletotrichum truncatum TaxID=5467 RepID=A0ACC3YUL7_COLTU|nr:C6 zinc finger domain-containing protein [Colletotrichum truncatum]KAF6785796.1 C6 zinc finger domain-containing protein [Colletotrichum truncatum]
MTTPPVWRPLPTSPSAGLPDLLVSTTFSTTSYEIHVTDLANIWTESMDRKAIYLRSLTESTSIDPTDSESNMRAFLSKIRSVFDDSHEDHEKASMTLSTNFNKDAGKDGLTMNITCELANMKPLEWPVYLRKSPQSKLTAELILPLTNANSTKSQQIDSLLAIMKHKDTVIAKLLDKLEATGTRLENVFTILSAKQKPTRQMAEEKVKGLAPFHFGEWESQFRNHSTDIPDIIRHVYGDRGLEYRRYPDMGHSDLDDWWTKLESSTIPIVGPTSRPISTELNKVSPGADTESLTDVATKRGIQAAEEDDDFQVQSTPPHLKSSRKRATAAAAGNHQDDSTEDEDEEASHIPDSLPAPPQKPNNHPIRLGTIGKKQPATPPSRSPHKSLQPEGSDTETESDADATASLAEISPPPNRNDSERTTTARGRLGRLGGGKQRSVTPEPPLKLESPRKGGLGRIGGTTHHPKSPEPSKKGSLGRIGGAARLSKTPEPSAVNTEERGRYRTESKPPEKPRETSQERADRKRDELQKELQRKAASGPARKKRKF